MPRLTIEFPKKPENDYLKQYDKFGRKLVYVRCQNCGKVVNPKLTYCPHCHKRARPDNEEHEKGGVAKSEV